MGTLVLGASDGLAGGSQFAVRSEDVFCVQRRVDRSGSQSTTPPAVIVQIRSAGPVVLEFDDWASAGAAFDTILGAINA
ncbi:MULTISPECIES: hypothetical protein [Jannaschia]|uniref:hypothetical protein n=1 Tax=Jannaschia TaxID=188905 RepID=UPI001C7DD14F|nr:MULTISPECIES: hypothetical protein [unclassified Jannaschia]